MAQDMKVEDNEINLMEEFSVLSPSFEQAKQELELNNINTSGINDDIVGNSKFFINDTKERDSLS